MYSYDNVIVVRQNYEGTTTFKTNGWRGGRVTVGTKSLICFVLSIADSRQTRRVIQGNTRFKCCLR